MKTVSDKTVEPAADLGMFSIFGQTGAPAKKGPPQEEQYFLQHRNMPEIMGDT